jgi:MFS family permease
MTDLRAAGVDDAAIDRRGSPASPRSIERVPGTVPPPGGEPTSGVLPEREARRLLVTVILGVVAFSSSMTIVSAVLASIATDLGTSPGVISWSVTGLFLTMAIGTPIMGRVGDAIGRRRVFLTGTAVITVGTLLCAVAWSAASFIGFRMLVGVGIALTMPNGMAMVINAFPPERRSVALGWFQMVMTGAPVLALVVGGWLAEAFGWRSVFVLLFPVALIGLVRARKIPPSPPSAAEMSIDWWGAATLGVGILSFLLCLERVKAAGLGDPVAGGLLAIAVVALVVFTRIERRVRLPLLRLDYFRRRNFTGPLIAQPLAQFAYMGGFVLTPLLLQDEFGLTVSGSAWLLLFRPGVFSVASPLGGRVAARFGTRAMILTGSVLMVASMAMFALGASSHGLGLVVGGLMLSGLGMGLASPSYATTVASAVDQADLGVANGMSTTLMNIGMLTGIQSMFTVLGDDRSGAGFAQVFWVGTAVAALSIAGGLLVRGRQRPA